MFSPVDVWSKRQINGKNSARNSETSDSPKISYNICRFSKRIIKLVMPCNQMQILKFNVESILYSPLLASQQRQSHPSFMGTFMRSPGFEQAHCFDQLSANILRRKKKCGPRGGYSGINVTGGSDGA